MHVGQMVVCVDDGPSHPGKARVPHRPERGRIYTIRGFAPYDADLRSVWLEELVNPQGRYLQGFVEPAFWVGRFRPVKETSIEIFRKLVAPMPFSAWQTGERVKNYE